MDWFSGCLNLFCLAAQGAMHIFFSSRLTGKTRRGWHCAVYIMLLCLLEGLAGRFALPWFVAVGAEMLLLYGVNRLLLGNAPPAAGSAAILAVHIGQLSFGLINSLEAVLFPCAVKTPLLYPLVAAATAAALAICAGCCIMVIKSISMAEISQSAAVGCLLFPALFFFAAELYLLQTAYTCAVCSAPWSASLLENAGKHAALLALQALGLGALFCTLYACRQLGRSMRTQTEMRLLRQAAQAQRVYIAEARTRCEQTKAFRHDIRNHLSVLDGLLRQGKTEEGRAYLQKMQAVSAALSLPCRTGNAVVDTLLSEKLGVAGENGIAAETELLLPEPCQADDFDLCVIFANALDNALAACQAVGGERWIHIRGERQGDFYLLTFQNTCAAGPMPPEGTGLSNIRAAAEKYHGAMMAEKTDHLFSLHVLLNISLPAERSSSQKPCTLAAG